MAAQRKEKNKVESFDPYELVPYACHLNPQTLVTKNAELVQIIKVSNSGGLSDDDFRENLRNVINYSIDPAKIAIWLHTVRSHKKKAEAGSQNYIKHVDILWKQSLPDELRYANTIYISVLIDFQKFSLWKPQNYLRSLSPSAEERRFNRVILERSQELAEVTDKMVERLKNFGARKLQIVNREGVYYSEPMEFLHKLLTFSDEQIPVSLGDISRNLYKEKFHFNMYTGQIAMQTHAGNHVGAVLSIKETSRIPANALKELLNSSYELVISEAIDFAFGNKKLPEYIHQKYVNSLAEDKKFVEIMGGRNYDPSPEDFALHQVNVLVMLRSHKEYVHALHDLHNKLSNLGIVSYIEDVRVERSFWSMLAGNFAFLKRQELVPRIEVANFSCFGVDKFTSVAGCMFSEPVTFFETSDHDTLALHFLNEGQSNILITGGLPEERQVVANLISAEAARFGGNIVFYDETGKYRNFAQSINAVYMDVLDLDAIKSHITEKTLIVFNSLKTFLAQDEEGLDFVFNFLDYAASKNATIIACAEFEDNCEPLLPNFRTQFYMHGNAERFADHFDLFEDEIRIIDLLEPGAFYFKHGNDELVLHFRPNEPLVRSLLEGAVR